MTPPTAAAFQDVAPVPVSTVGQAFSILHEPSRVQMVSCNQSPWMKHLNKRSDDITRLEIGWDGYGGRLVSCTNAVFAACLIERLYTPGVPAPQIVPGSDGTLQIEWHRRGLSVELDVLKPFQVVATKIIQGNGEAEEHMLGCEFSLVADWIDQLKQLSDAREYSGDATLR